MIIVSVLRLSKDFTTQHAQWLHKQLVGYNSVCLTDAKYIKGVNTAPLLYNWPGWWSKIELFNPEHPVLGKEDILYMDLDTVITGDISDFLKVEGLTMLSDFGDPNNVNSSLMKISCADKEKVWKAFINNPMEIMEKCQTPELWGDQGFIGSITTPQRWQDILPGKVVSYKANIAKPGMIGFNQNLYDGIANGELPSDARIVCFHGSPRPWNTVFSWVPRYNFETYLKATVKNLKKEIKNKLS